MYTIVPGTLDGEPALTLRGRILEVTVLPWSARVASMRRRDLEGSPDVLAVEHGNEPGLIHWWLRRGDGGRVDRVALNSDRWTFSSQRTNASAVLTARLATAEHPVLAPQFPAVCTIHLQYALFGSCLFMTTSAIGDPRLHDRAWQLTGAIGALGGSAQDWRLGQRTDGVRQVLGGPTLRVELHHTAGANEVTMHRNDDHVALDAVLRRPQSHDNSATSRVSVCVFRARPRVARSPGSDVPA
jgi:hypothetical protein